MIPPVGYDIDDYDLDNENNRDYLPNDVLKNKFGITETSALNAIEKDYSNIRSTELLLAEDKPQFTTSYYLGLHQQIFQDVYPWAGMPRVVDTAKGDSLFTPHQFIIRDLDKALSTLEADLKTSKTVQNFGESFGKFLGAVNNIHPFAEGNGRTQRLYISKVASEYDFQINWEKISNEAMKEASIHAHENNFQPMVKLISRSLELDLGSNEPPIIKDNHLKSEDSYYLHYKSELDNEIVTGVVTNISEKYIVLKKENAYLILSRKNFDAKSLIVGKEATFYNPDKLENSLNKDNLKNNYPQLSASSIEKITIYKNHLLEKYSTTEARTHALGQLAQKIPDIANGKIELPKLPVMDMDISKGKGR